MRTVIPRIWKCFRRERLTSSNNKSVEGEISSSPSTSSTTCRPWGRQVVLARGPWSRTWITTPNVLRTSTVNRTYQEFGFKTIIRSIPLMHECVTQRCSAKWSVTCDRGPPSAMSCVVSLVHPFHFPTLDTILPRIGTSCLADFAAGQSNSTESQPFSIFGFSSHRERHD